MENEFLNIDEASLYLRLSKHTLYQYVARKIIPHYKLGSKLQFRRDHLDRWRGAKYVPAFGESPEISNFVQ